MDYNNKFLKIFRGEPKNFTVTDVDIKRVIEKIEMYSRVCKEHGELKTILRQSGLTYEEMLDLVENKDKHIKRIKRLGKKSVAVRQVPTKEVNKELEEKKEMLLKRLYYGDTLSEATTSLWIPHKTKVIRDFVEKLEKDGYIIKKEDFHILYKIREDIEYNHYTIDEILVKYPHFSREVLKKNLSLHGVPFREYRDKKVMSI